MSPGWDGAVMRKSLTALLAGCASGLAAAALLSAGAAPAGATPSQGRYLYPLAGDSRYLVYSQSHRRYGSINEVGCATGRPTLHVRDKAGHTRTLAVAQDGQSYAKDVDPCEGVSLNGDLLTMDGGSGRHETIFWWDLERHTHGTAKLPLNVLKSQFVGTVPGGWLYAPLRFGDNETSTTLYRQGIGGKVTKFATLPRFFVEEVPKSTRGIVTGDFTPFQANPLHYLRYGSSAPRTLDSPAHKYRDEGCSGVTATYVACDSVFESDREVNPAIYKWQESITPLSGKPTIVNERVFAPKVGEVRRIAVAPGGVVGLLWPSKGTSKLRGFGTGGRISSAPGHGARELTVAYGQIVVGHRGGQITLQRSVTSKQHKILG
jgi:hypothetical protein